MYLKIVRYGNNVSIKFLLCTILPHFFLERTTQAALRWKMAISFCMRHHYFPEKLTRLSGFFRRRGICRLWRSFRTWASIPSLVFFCVKFVIHQNTTTELPVRQVLVLQNQRLFCSPKLVGNIYTVYKHTCTSLWSSRSWGPPAAPHSTQSSHCT